mgnify:CR=1 FL=1|tara:strand:+ start:360 stop:776 length:417 start_codon:yes stop_codon:yes gene_type:complete
MKKSELKNIIKECVKEVLFEEGVLSNLVAEVAFGITRAQQTLLESSTKVSQADELRRQAAKKQESEEQERRRLLESKKKMLDAIGNKKMANVFEGTEPLPNSATSVAHGPMSGRDPSDAGVDISGLFGLAGQKWQHLK